MGEIGVEIEGAIVEVDHCLEAVPVPEAVRRLRERLDLAGDALAHGVGDPVPEVGLLRRGQPGEVAVQARLLTLVGQVLDRRALQPAGAFAHVDLRCHHATQQPRVSRRLPLTAFPPPNDSWSLGSLNGTVNVALPREVGRELGEGSREGSAPRRPQLHGVRRVLLDLE